MDEQERAAETQTGQIFLRKQIQVTLDFETEFREVEVHPEDKKAINTLRDQLLSDDEAIAKFLLFHCLSQIAFDLPKILSDLRIYDISASDIVKSKARSLPKELLENLLDLEMAGLGFAYGIDDGAVNSRISKIQFFDLDRASEIKVESEPEPLIIKYDRQKCLLAKAESEWIALLQVWLNHAVETDNNKAFDKALGYMDDIQEQVSASSLPLKEISIGIIAAEQAEYETARVRIEKYASAKLPGTKVNMWFRQEKPVKFISFTELIRTPKSQGGQEIQNLPG